MAATALPANGLPTNPPTVTKKWIPGIGETETQEWAGTKADIAAKYELFKTDSKIGGLLTGNMTELNTVNAEGRNRLVAQFERQEQSITTHGQNTRVVEELYAVDIVRDVRSSPYWSTAGTALTDDNIAWVTECADKQYDEAEIDVYAVKPASNKPLYAAWSASMKQLRYHLLHGQESYFETAFQLRRSLFGVSTSVIQASFTDINTVVTAPTFESEMDKLILALPSGEWLYKPPQAEQMGGGSWRITQEWHWATAWSKIYGGTWGL